ncbi:hypothetical protein GEMRC1_008591 [Eukaryota sp. GEM-RC1]
MHLIINKVAKKRNGKFVLLLATNSFPVQLIVQCLILQMFQLYSLFWVLVLLSFDISSVSSSDWRYPQNGFWTTSPNWDPPEVPTESCSVTFSIPTSPVTVTIDSPVTVANLTLVNDIILLFTNNASLTVLNSLTMYGGTLQSHSSSFLSNTSTPHLLLDGFDFSLSSHILIITFNISWYHGIFSLDHSSKLLLSNSQFNIDATPELQGSNQI